MSKLACRSLILAGAVSTLAVFGSACAERKMAEKQTRIREDQMANAARIYVEHETSCPERMDRTIGIAARKHESDVAATDANGQKIGRWIEYDFRRWDEQQPVYQRHLQNQMRGKPEAVERSAIILFW